MVENPLQNVTFPSNGSTAHGYLALPAAGSGPGVIVIQEWWGLTSHIADVTNRLAAEGFVALAPDLFGGTTAHDSDEAGELMQQLPVEQAARDLAGATDFLLAHEAVTSSTVGTVGFCMGGGFVITMAAQLGDKISVAVPFYGIVQGDPDLSGITATMVGHFGTQDQMISTTRWPRSRPRSPTRAAPRRPSTSTTPGTPSSTTRTCSAPTTPSRPDSPGHAPCRPLRRTCADPRTCADTSPDERAHRRCRYTSCACTDHCAAGHSASSTSAYTSSTTARAVASGPSVASASRTCSSRCSRCAR